MSDQQQLQQPAEGTLLLTVCQENGQHTNVYSDGAGGTRGENFEGECTPFIAENGTMISQRCEGTTLIKTVVDTTQNDNEGQVIIHESADCGFEAATQTEPTAPTEPTEPTPPVDHPAAGEVIGEDCDGTTKIEHVADGNGGHTVRTTEQSAECGYVAPQPEPEPNHPPKDTVLTTECSGTTKVIWVADGQGGRTNRLEQESKDCGFEAPVVDKMQERIDLALQSPNRNIQMIAKVLGEYRLVNGRSKPCDVHTLHERQLQLWAALRAGVYETQAFRDLMDLVMAFFRENRDGAFDLDMLLRTIDLTSSRLNGDQRKAYSGLMSTLTVAAGLNNLSDVKKKVNLDMAISSQIFSGEARMRIVGYFD